ncbi:hypothetical protein UO85_18635 [Enterobacter kobei]|nr:hypothetical protein UO85_18635 [Enterobacter kobei]
MDFIGSVTHDIAFKQVRRAMLFDAQLKINWRVSIKCVGIVLIVRYRLHFRCTTVYLALVVANIIATVDTAIPNSQNSVKHTVTVHIGIENELINSVFHKHPKVNVPYGL